MIIPVFLQSTYVFVKHTCIKYYINMYEYSIAFEIQLLFKIIMKQTVTQYLPIFYASHVRKITAFFSFLF